MQKSVDYKRVIVIGYGAVTGEVLKLVHDLSHKYGYLTEYIEYEVHDFNTAKKYCAEENITMNTLEEKELVTEYLGGINEKTLIISASNNYLIPKNILDMDYVTAINFHNALLPKFPGRNAPSWVIYEGEERTGITWHYVTSRVDAGKIIIQKEIDIDSDVKAYELAGKLMTIAFEAFSECIEGVLTDSIEGFSQTLQDKRKMYLSKDIPQEGKFDITDSWDSIYRLLRATDYGKYDIFPPVKTVIDGKAVLVIRYKLVEKDKAKSGEGFLNINADNGRVLQIKYKYVDNQ